jgi:hypothetical protein
MYLVILSATALAFPTAIVSECKSVEGHITDRTYRAVVEAVGGADLGR